MRFNNEYRTVMPTVLVTGASGFVGQNLIRSLVRRRYKVKAYSRQPHQARSETENREIDWVTGDLFNKERLLSACQGVDIVFHAAGIAHAGARNKDEAFQVNVFATQSVYDASAASGAKTFVFFSSILADQEHDTPYVQSKLAAEKFLLSSSASTGTQVVILRPANVYGVAMRGNISTFIKLARKGILPALPKVDGSLSMISVQDLCDAAIILATQDHDLKQPPIYPITDGRSYSVNEIEDIVYSALGKRKPRFTLPRQAFFVASILMQTLNSLGILRNAAGVELYKNVMGIRAREAHNEKFPYGILSTTSLETEMPKIIAGICEE